MSPTLKQRVEWLETRLSRLEEVLKKTEVRVVELENTPVVFAEVRLDPRKPQQQVCKLFSDVVHFPPYAVATEAFRQVRVKTVVFNFEYFCAYTLNLENQYVTEVVVKYSKVTGYNLHSKCFEHLEKILQGFPSLKCVTLEGLPDSLRERTCLASCKEAFPGVLFTVGLILD